MAASAWIRTSVAGWISRDASTVAVVLTARTLTQMRQCRRSPTSTRPRHELSFADYLGESARRCRSGSSGAHDAFQPLVLFRADLKIGRREAAERCEGVEEPAAVEPRVLAFGELDEFTQRVDLRQDVEVGDTCS